MNDNAEAKLFTLSDLVARRTEEIHENVLALGVKVDTHRCEALAHRQETNEMRRKMDSGFARVVRRLGRIETRVEDVETELRAFRGDFERRVTRLELP